MVLGWREWVSLPGLRLPRIRAKLDTGARSSALHVTDVEPFRRARADWVRFRVVTDRGQRGDRTVEAHAVDERIVRDSGGKEHLRVVIETVVSIAGWDWPIELTLASRSEMSFRMLLGRQALSGRVIVDPSHSYLAGRPPRKTKIRRT